jgi:hypothetical protein
VLLAVAVAGLPLAAGVARADEPPAEPPKGDDPLEASRAQFRRGMEAYTAGDYAGAIVVWQAIYDTLGPERGYRLAFNLGRAFDAFGDASRATEFYDVYLGAVRARRARGEALPELVERQAHDAEARLEELSRSRGRVRVPPTKAPVLVRVDRGTERPAGFSVLLAPGPHTLTFRTGATSVERTIDVVAGEERVVEPPPPEEAPRRREPVPVFETRTVRPFSPVWIFVGAGATAVSVLVPAIQYGSALSIASTHDASDDPLERERLASEYSGAKTAAYTTLSIPIVLGVATIALGTAFVLGARSETVRVGRAGAGFVF